MQSYKHYTLQIILLVVVILTVGTVGYGLIEDGWTWLDALYMTVITITTVGFAEIHELTPGGRVFTIILIFMGLGTVATFATQLAKFVIEGQIKGVFGRKKMQDTIKKLNNHYIICGYGRIGSTIGLKLFEMDIPFVVVDRDADVLAEAERRGFPIIAGNATTDGTLLAAGINAAAGVVATIPDDAANLFIALAARELNPDMHIIVRGSSRDIEERMLRAGADTVVYPMALGGEQIARLIARQAGRSADATNEARDPGVMGYYLKVFRHYDATTTTVGTAVASSGAMRAVALKTGDGKTVHDPPDEATVGHNDAVVLLVRESGAEEADLSEGLSDKLKWTDDLLVGVVSIDDEHRELFRYAADFHAAVTAGKEREATRKLFNRLLDYTVYHFRNEEGFMQRHGYPDLESHIGEHRRLTNAVMELNRERSYVFPANVDAFLSSWLKDHIMDRDKRFGAFLKGRNKSA